MRRSGFRGGGFRVGTRTGSSVLSQNKDGKIRSIDIDIDIDIDL